MALKRNIIYGAAFLTAVSAGASASHAAAIQFESASDLAAFSLENNGDTAATADTFTYASGVGRSGSGGVTVASVDQTHIYNASTISTSNSNGITAAVFFETGSTAPLNTGVIQIGFTDSTSHGFYGVAGATNFISARVNAGTFQTQVANSGTTSNGAGVAAGLTTSEWYQLAVTFVPVATANTFSYVATLTDYGTTGASATGATPLSLLGTVTETALYTDAAAFAGVRTTTAQLTAAVDSFSFSSAAVPEPASLGLLGLATVAAIARKRR